ncbi:MAG: metal ABC transporter substrate-binding protein, partial [Hyphomicrobiales bacterium]
MPNLLFRFALLAPLAIGGLFAASCGNSDDARAGTPDRLEVVATIAPVGAVAKAVGGEFVDVHVLVKPGVDPHEFSLRVGDRKAIADADVILRNGIGIDSFLDKNLDDVRERVTTVSEGVEIRGEAGDDGDEDPHIWQSPENVKVMARNALDALVRADPGHAAQYRANADAYIARLDEADQQVRAIIGSIPPANRKLVTNHDAFGYFIERYGLEFVGAVIPGQTTAAEPSAKDISKLEDTIRRE